MEVFIMYTLMIVDLTWTLMHHEEAGELNPLFTRLLLKNEVVFVYLKLAANTAAAFLVIILRHRRPLIGSLIAVLGILVYGFVVWLHWFVDYCFRHAEEVQNSTLWNLMQGG